MQETKSGNAAVILAADGSVDRHAQDGAETLAMPAAGDSDIQMGDMADVPGVAPRPGGPGLPSDDLFGYQWHLLNTGQLGGKSGIDINVTGVWDDYTGQGVRVGVLEGGGVQYIHPDLAGNYDSSRDWNAVTGNGSVTYALANNPYHATAVAGVIGSVAGNGEGTVGVAYDASLSSYQFDYNTSSVSDVASLYDRARIYGMDVINNSWGYNNAFAATSSNPFFSTFATSLRNSVLYGRGGLGTIIVKSGGNDRTRDNWSNGSEFNNSPYTIAVGAVGEDGSYSYFSSPGANLLVTAPSSDLSSNNWIATTDYLGSNGYDWWTGSGYLDGDYTNDFSGTSASGPMVSGVAALMLEANPLLGYRDVQEILAYSARNAILTPPSSGDQPWQFNDARNWNGGGLHTNIDYGFGLVDALAAVRLAETWTAQQTFVNESIATYHSSSSSVFFDGGSIEPRTLSVPANFELEHVEVNIDLSHARAEHLVAKLISPGGTESLLMNRDGGPVSFPGSGYTLTSTQFWGEESAGTWRLELSDVVSGYGGTFRDWSITVRGNALSADDTYIYTNEFGGFTSDASRKTLSDGGGTDTINAAAVTSNTVLDLNAGATSTIAGNGLTIAAGTVIENAFGGDGADTITGNAAGNVLDGGRGDDTLAGGAGDDTLIGGAGGDALDGGAGTDTVSYSGSSAGVTVDLGAATASGGDASGDTLSGIENITGSGLADTLTGTGGANTLSGGAGDDTLAGGAGGDALDGGAGTDTLSYAGSAFGVTVNLGSNAVSGGDAAGDTVSNFENVTGSGNDDTLTGDTGANVLNGGSGNDTLAGGSGDDALIGGAGGDALDGGSGFDTAFYGDSGTGVTVDLRAGTGTGGTAQGDTLSGVERVDGSSYGDLLLGLETADTLAGGDGNDSLVARGGDDALNGGAGDDWLRGGGGNDSLDGGSGYDTASYGDSGAAVTIDLSAGTGLGGDAQGDTLSGIERVDGSSFGDLLLGLETADTLAGGDGNDSLVARGGNDALSGGTGDDTLDGGAGNDTIATGSGADRIVMAHGAGADTVTDFTQGADLIDVSVYGIYFSQIAVSDAGGNALIGILDDSITLNGIAATDVSEADFVGLWVVPTVPSVITGTAGADTILPRSVSAGVIVNPADNLGTTELNDTIAGLGGDDVISAAGGDDTIAWGIGDGSDTVDGGADNDTFAVTGDGAGSVFTIGAGTSAVQVAVDETGDGSTDAMSTLTNVEDVTIDTGAGADTISIAGDFTGTGLSTSTITVTGGDGGVTVDASGVTSSHGIRATGGAGADTLTGGAGADTLSGGGGNDTFNYALGGGDDVITGGAGTDRLVIGDLFDLTDAVRSGNDLVVNMNDGGTVRVVGSGSSDAARTEELENGATGAVWQIRSGLTSTAGNDAIVGTAGADTIDGGAGVDIVVGGDGADSVSGGAGVDYLYGNAGDDTLEGGADVDYLYGNAGDDTLEGGAGGDFLDGGAGTDTVSYAGSSAGVTIDLGAGTVGGGDAAGDALSGIENLVGSAFADVLTGDAGDNLLRGGAGADILTGGLGIDTVSYAGSSAGVNVNFSTGTASGGDAAGDVHGGIQNLVGSGFADVLKGDWFSNTLTGGAGADILSGGLGTDTVSYAGSSAGVAVDLGEGTASGGDAAGDTLSEFENLTGSGLADTLTGDGGANVIDGGAGDDTLSGGAGNDTIVTGDGADTIVMAPGAGADTVADFTQGADRIDVSAYDMLFGQITITDDGAGNALVQVGSESVVLTGIAPGDVVAGDFIGLRVNPTVPSDITGTAGDDTIQLGYASAGVTVNPAANSGATNFGDTIAGLGGDDDIEAAGGDDTVSWGIGDGSDTVDGGAGTGDVFAVTGDGSASTFAISAAAGAVQVAVDETGDGSTDATSTLTNVEDVTIDTGAGADTVTISGDFTGTGLSTSTVTVNGGDGGITVDGSGVTSAHGIVATGGAGTDTLGGGGGDDVLSGGGGNDTFNYALGGGNDAITGGAGTDRLVIADLFDLTDAVRSGNDLVVNMNDGGTVTVVGSGSTDADRTEELENGATGVVWQIRSDLTSTAGNDAIVGTTGADTLDGGAGIDIVVGGDGADSVSGGAEVDYLYGNAGDDTIEGGAGGDLMDGGAGSDTLSYAGAGAGVAVDLSAGTGTLGDAAGDTFFNFENLTGSGHGDDLTGDTGVNVIDGGAGDDTLEGGAAGDTLDGGLGIDTLSYAGSAAAVTVDLGTGTVSGGDAAGDTIANFENVIGSAGNDDLTGDAGANALSGGAGDDTINWSIGDGSDTVDGGAGNDTFALTGDASANDIAITAGAGSISVSVDETDDGSVDATSTLTGVEDITIDTGAGADMVTIVGDFTGTGLSTSTVTVNGGDGGITVDAAGVTSAHSVVANGGVGVDTLTGGAGADILSGGAEDDTLEGGTGADDLDGGLGTDTISYAGSSAGVTVDLEAGTASGGDAAGDSISNFENVTGSGQGDTLTGDGGANTLSGGGGNDSLDGGAGGDVLDGGAGVDTVSFAGSSTGVTVDLGSGTASGGDAAGDTISDVENVIGSMGDDSLTGDGANNVLTGGAGNDTLVGGDGIDSAVFSGNFADYAIYGNAVSGLSIVDNNMADGNDGTDSVDGIEQLVFADQTIDLTADIAPVAYAAKIEVPVDYGLVTNRLTAVDIGGGANVVSFQLAGTPNADGWVATSKGQVRLTDASTGAYEYLASPGQSGLDSFQFVSSDGTLSDTQTVSVSLGSGSSSIVLSPDTVVSSSLDDVNWIRAASLSNGNVVVGWVDNDPPNSYEFRVLGSDGAVVRSQSIPYSDYSGDISMDVASLSGGGFAVLMVRDAGSTSEIEAVLFDHDGQQIGDTISVSSSVVLEKRHPRVTGLPDGGFVATWTDNLKDVVVQRFDSNGGKVGPEITAYQGVNSYVFGTEVATLSDGGFVVGWHTGQERIYAQRYDATGTAVDAAFQINSYRSNNQHYLELEPLVGGGFVAVWESFGQDGDAWGSYGHVFNSDGTSVGSEFRINSTVAGSSVRPSVAALDDGGFLVSFQSNHLSGSYQAFAQQFDSTGARVDDEILVGPYDGGSATVPAVVRTPDGDVEAFWTTGRSTVHRRSLTPASDSVGFSGVGSAGGDFLVLHGSGNALLGNGGDDTLFGDDAANDLDGGIGADDLNGKAGDDNLTGGLGDDTLTGGAGGDALDGGAGTDTAAYGDSGAAVTIDLRAGTGTGGTAQGDTLSGIERVDGSSFGDLLLGLETADTLAGGDGNDSLVARGGDDALSGGAGDDWLRGGGGGDALEGGAGFDTASYGDSGTGVTVDLRAGTGTGGTAQGDTLSGIERVDGSSFGDLLLGLETADALAGGDGNDSLVARGGDDALSGGAGDDWLRGGGGGDALEGGSGFDTASYGDSGTGVTVDLRAGTGTGGTAQGDTLSGIERVDGSSFGDLLLGLETADTLAGGDGDDSLVGRGGDDALIGGDGNDFLRGSAGADMINGGAGYDTASYGDSGAAVTIDLSAGTGLGGDAQGDTLGNVERVDGSTHDDTLLGDGEANTLSGGAGVDVINGRGGADMLIGGAGDDSFVFEAGSGDDTITDFAAGAGSDDVMDISAYGYTDLASILAVTTDDGAGNTTIQLDGANSVTLSGVSAGDLHGDDFTGLVSAMTTFGASSEPGTVASMGSMEDARLSPAMTTSGPEPVMSTGSMEDERLVSATTTSGPEPMMSMGSMEDDRLISAMASFDPPSAPGPVASTGSMEDDRMTLTVNTG